MFSTHQPTFIIISCPFLLKPFLDKDHRHYLPVRRSLTANEIICKIYQKKEAVSHLQTLVFVILHVAVAAIYQQ